MSEIRTTDMELINKFKQLEQSYNGLKNSTSIMFATVSEIQNQQQVNKIKPESLNGDMTTEMDRGATGAVKPSVKISRHAKFNYRFVTIPSLYHL